MKAKKEAEKLAEKEKQAEETTVVADEAPAAEAEVAEEKPKAKRGRKPKADA